MRLIPPQHTSSSLSKRFKKPPKKASKKPSWLKKAIKKIGKLFLQWVCLMIIWGALFLCALLLWVGSELPDITEIAQLARHPSITFLDKKGTFLFSYGDLYGEPVSAKDLPPHVIHALLAIEDRRFYKHWGVDPIGIIRALVQNMRKKSVVQGGSTITQQLAKNFLQSKKIFTYKDRSLKRKIMEAFLAFQIEWRFTKDQILTMHLNRVYMGAGTWGIDAAAKKYFGCSAKKLGLYEAAILMGLLKGPSYYSPTVDHQRSESRAKQVLQAMVEAEFISDEAVVAAMALPVPLAQNSSQHSARYFTDWAADQLNEIVDTEHEDLVVTTTLDLTMQRIAETYARQVIEQRGPLSGVKQISLVSMDQRGAIHAMVGGLDFRKSAFNRTTCPRQPGSTFKYFVYLAALENGYTPNDTLSDREISLGGWKPKNYKYKSSGSISIKTAFAKSVNSVAARLIHAVGINRVKEMAERLGLTTPLSHNYSIALGTSGAKVIEMTSAFGAILANGSKVLPYGITAVRNRKGKILYQHAHEQKIVLDKAVVAHMKTLLREVITSGTGRITNLSDITIMGKTGTSNKGNKDRDSWFIGMSPKLVTGVWSGCDDEAGMVSVPGGSSALHLFKAFNQGITLYGKNPHAPEWEQDDLPLLPAYQCQPSMEESKNISSKKDSKVKEDEDEEEDEEDADGDSDEDTEDEDENEDDQEA